ncbi:hypothetical protein TW79_02355 [Tritonibacter mobilis]|uniref:Uncharacterized protein n=1 Tax=Tritonibacter mobilis F1926 TaxID=1265309 RepID=A0A1B1A5C7_9RHOB|nr:hypothetical protein K529_013500 [Tritonibacter mobilis F1926]KJZ25998.1 hypothetical protein TW79_02355 [Tritonibacter mobilis]
MARLRSTSAVFRLGFYRLSRGWETGECAIRANVTSAGAFLRISLRITGGKGARSGSQGEWLGC